MDLLKIFQDNPRLLKKAVIISILSLFLAQIFAQVAESFNREIMVPFFNIIDPEQIIETELNIGDIKLNLSRILSNIFKVLIRISIL